MPARRRCRRRSGATSPDHGHGRRDPRGAVRLGRSAELATFVSPALATALLLGVGAAAVFAVDAATFALSSSLLLRVRVRQRGATVERAGALREFRDGWQAVRERTWVWATIAGFSVAVFAALAPFFVLGATVGHEVYGSAAVYGWATAAWGAGTVSGVAIGARWRPRRPMFAGVLAATSWPAVIAVFAVGPPLGVLYAVMAAGGIGLGAFQVWWETALAERIPPHLLSRVSAWDWMARSLCCRSATRSPARSRTRSARDGSWRSAA
ncbi:MAG TPA: MFS transporter [Jatrophihabitantaceae bacterium]|nr:MFS transporter [Jatrophihabitantaceae bacterium]